MNHLPVNIHLRPVTVADRPAVKALVYGILAEYGLSPDPSGTDKDLEHLPDSYVRSGGCFFLFEDTTNKIIGTGGLYVLSPAAAEIRKMYLLPEARGRGLGRYMLQYLVQQAREKGLHRLELETASVLKEAVGLYHSAGFTSKAAPEGQSCHNSERPLANRCDQLLELML